MKKRLLFILILFSLLGSIWLLIKKTSHTLESSVFTVARDVTWYPLRLMNKGQNLVAFSDDLIFEIAQKEGIYIQMVNASSHALLSGLDSENYDAILSSLLPTAISRERYLFSEPYFLTGPVLLVPSDSTISSLKEMEGKIIGVQAGSSVVFNVSHYPNLLITSYDNILDALDHLANQRIDGVILDAIPAYIYVNSLYKNSLTIATPPLTKEGFRLVARHDRTGERLIHLFNEGLKNARKSNLYKQLLDKWGLYEFEALITPPITPENNP